MEEKKTTNASVSNKKKKQGQKAKSYLLNSSGVHNSIKTLMVRYKIEWFK